MDKTDRPTRTTDSHKIFNLIHTCYLSFIHSPKDHTVGLGRQITMSSKVTLSLSLLTMLKLNSSRRFRSRSAMVVNNLEVNDVNFPPFIVDKKTVVTAIRSITKNNISSGVKTCQKEEGNNVTFFQPIVNL